MEFAVEWSLHQLLQMQYRTVTMSLKEWRHLIQKNFGFEMTKGYSFHECVQQHTTVTRLFTLLI